MNLLEGIILGVLQGLTEFLPVSSSGHLVLMQNLLGFRNLEQYVLFDLVLHLGTLLAVLIVFRESIKSILLSRRIYILYIIIGVLALAPFKFAFPFLKSFYNAPQYLGCFFIATALLLALGEFFQKLNSGRDVRGGIKFLHCALISASQVIAILPGVSRSGTTVSVARALGWKSEDAAEYSFLLAVPVILAGSLLEWLDVVQGEVTAKSVPSYIYALGFLTAFVVGVFALKLFLRLLTGGKFKYFIIYCTVLGIFCLIYFNV